MKGAAHTLKSWEEGVGGLGGREKQSKNGSRKNLIKADDAAGIFIFCWEKWKSGQVAQADFILNVAIASKAFGNGVGTKWRWRGVAGV